MPMPAHECLVVKRIMDIWRMLGTEMPQTRRSFLKYNSLKHRQVSESFY